MTAMTSDISALKTQELLNLLFESMKELLVRMKPVVTFAATAFTVVRSWFN